MASYQETKDDQDGEYFFLTIIHYSSVIRPGQAQQKISFCSDLTNTEIQQVDQSWGESQAAPDLVMRWEMRDGRV